MAVRHIGELPLRDINGDVAEILIDKHWIPYVRGVREGQWMADAPIEDARTTFAQIALECVGSTANVTGDYTSIIAPGETPAMTRDLMGVQGCGMVVRGIMRLFGVSHPSLAPPYVTGSAFLDVDLVFASAVGGKRPHYRRAFDLPCLGAVMVVGHGIRTHMAVRVNGAPITTVDGGQVTKEGRQTILKRTRTRANKDGVWFLGDREIIRWYDPAELRPLCALQWRIPHRLGGR